MAKKQDVTEQYLAMKGSVEEITYEPNYDHERHSSEIKTAKWIIKTFGGKIKLLTELQHKYEGKRSDYLWNNKYWELKNTHSAKTVDSVLRKGIHQIMQNPGGIILIIGDSNSPLKSIEAAIETRIKKSCRFTIDVLIVVNEKLVKALRFSK